MDDIFSGAAKILDQAGFDAALGALGTPGGAASLWAVISVETRGFGFLPDRRPKILFERHIFDARTKGRFRASHPDLSNPTPGGYAGGAAEYQRLKLAMVLDRTNALESASWGLGQVMGFNAASIGYADVDAMVQAFMGSETEQLLACAKFIAGRPALLRAYEAGDWERVAFYYNGQGYKKNAYDTKLQTFEATYANAADRPQLGVRRVQALLSYLGFDPNGVDGKVGNGTRRALRAFAVSRGMDASLIADNSSAIPQGLVDAIDAAAAQLGNF
jgi:hypothetical protein